MKMISKDGKLYVQTENKDIGLTYWKFLGVEFTSIGEVSILKIFGVSVYGKVGYAHFLLGLTWRLDKYE